MFSSVLVILGRTSEHCSGLFYRLGDVPHLADLRPLCVGARQGGHGLDGAQVVLQLQNELLLLRAGSHCGRELHLQLCIAACGEQRGQMWIICGSFLIQVPCFLHI